LPFRSQDDENSGIMPPIMDEQEQEEVVELLRSQNEISNLENTRILQALLSCSLLLQLMFLIGHKNGSSWTPISPILSSDARLRQPLIPTSRLWTLLNITQHIHDMMFSDPHLQSLIPHTPLVNLREQRIWAITLLPLTLALILRTSGSQGPDTTQIVWWGIAPAMAGITSLIRQWIREGRQDLQQLTKLKYKSKGA